MASAITSLPGQQQPQPVSSTSSENWHSSSSGSIGPFLGVISVLTVLAILSCILGRVCRRRAEAAEAVSTETAGGLSVDVIKHRDYFGWLKRKSRWFKGGDVEVGAKVMAVDQEKQDSKAQP